MESDEHIKAKKKKKSIRRYTDLSINSSSIDKNIEIIRLNIKIGVRTVISSISTPKKKYIDLKMDD
jgi:hypothetical protein